jgi:hypothetical protein
MKLPVGTDSPGPPTPSEGTYRNYQLDDGYYYVDRYEKSGWVNVIKTRIQEIGNE